MQHYLHVAQMQIISNQCRQAVSTSSCHTCLLLLLLQKLHELYCVYKDRQFGGATSPGGFDLQAVGGNLVLCCLASLLVALKRCFTALQVLQPHCQRCAVQQASTVMQAISTLPEDMLCILFRCCFWFILYRPEKRLGV